MKRRDSARNESFARRFTPSGCDSVGTKRFSCPDGSFGVNLLAKLSLRRDSARHESFARKFTPNDRSGQLNVIVRTLSHPEGANESTVSATRSKIPLDCAIGFA